MQVFTNIGIFSSELNLRAKVTKTLIAFSVVSIAFNNSAFEAILFVTSFSSFGISVTEPVHCASNSSIVFRVFKFNSLEEVIFLNLSPVTTSGSLYKILNTISETVSKLSDLFLVFKRVACFLRYTFITEGSKAYKALQNSKLFFFSLPLPTKSSPLIIPLALAAKL
jgi:hypothetical protein